MIAKLVHAWFVVLLFPVSGLFAAEPSDYNKQVAPIFKKYCLGCHHAQEAGGELALDNMASLMRGGEHGPVVVAGQADKSRLILLLEKKAKPFMPPEGNKGPTAAEIGVLRAWIASGAKGPKGVLPKPPTLVTPKIKPLGKVREPIQAIAFSPDGKWIAVARYGRVEILSGQDQKLLRTLAGHVGHVNDVGFSADGKKLFVAAGEAGLSGQAVLWSTADWKRILTISGHRDSIYAAALSPDGNRLATGSYDQKIKLWDTATGKELRELAGHNGAVFDLAFHAGGTILASASGDRTVKLWDVASGKRLDTLIEPTKDQYTLAISPDGRYIAAGGVDNRIRVWEVREMGRGGTNPIRYTRFAHEGAILKLAFSPNGRWLVSSSEDRTIKIWKVPEFTQQRAIKGQSDWVSALAISPESSTLLAGRMDGTWSMYSIASGTAAGLNVAKPVQDVPLSKPRGNPVGSAKLVEVVEVEPNDFPDKATPLPAPGTVKGVLMPPEGKTQDVDLFRFETVAGQTWILETMAARNKSPADTKIEVLHADGSPVERLLLRAARDSSLTFQPINSSQNRARVTNWEEMELNQYLYMGGEVCKLYRRPRGPDSGFVFYSNRSKRRCYFDTSATIHAKDDPIYIVEPYPPGTKLADNGLPVFTLYHSNDDDGERKLGNDSQLTFTAPADGAYLVRVTDVRGFGGTDFKYSLTIREPKPDFRVTLDGKGATVAAGSGQRLTVKLERIDHFDGEVRVEITGLPDGFSVSSPIVVQAGHLEAQGVIHVASNVAVTVKPTREKDDKAPVRAIKPNAPVKAIKPKTRSAPKIDWSNVKVTATAMIHGRKVQQDVGDLGEIQVDKKPDYIVKLELDQPPRPASDTKSMPELVIAPATMVTAMLRIERNGHKGELTFSVDNLPHGIIVDNIGLNGILIREGESHRQIYLTAREWVPETTRLIHAVARGQGNQASLPMLLRVRKPGQVARVGESVDGSNESN
jgi:WD40 repeat protein